jgi:hypothetical protein
MITKTFSNAELADCADREVRHRQRLYSYKVGQKEMSPEFAADQIAMMQQIAREYRAKAAEEAAKDDLFGRFGGHA